MERLQDAVKKTIESLNRLRNDPAFKLACGRLPDTDRDLCSQPTLSRLENAPCLRDKFATLTTALGLRSR
jgi:DDE family transposase